MRTTSSVWYLVLLLAVGAGEARVNGIPGGDTQLAVRKFGANLSRSDPFQIFLLGSLRALRILAVRNEQISGRGRREESRPSPCRAF